MNHRSTFGSDLIEALGEAVRVEEGEETGATARVVAVDTVDVRSIRRSLGMSRPRFAAVFGLEARSVQEWEQGRRRPDKATRSFLKVIARNPSAVADALAE